MANAIHGSISGVTTGIPDDETQALVHVMRVLLQFYWIVVHLRIEKLKKKNLVLDSEFEELSALTFARTVEKNQRHSSQ